MTLKYLKTTMSTNRIAILTNLGNLASNKWITTNDELCIVLKKCCYCSRITDKGKNIVSYEELDTIKINKLKKCCIVINTTKTDTNDKIGHWITLYYNCGQALVYDPLNTLHKSHPLVCSKINSYCNKNNIKLKYLSIQTQALSSLACGFHNIWFIHNSHKTNTKGVIKLEKMLTNFSIKNREKFIISDVLKSFRL